MDNLPEMLRRKNIKLYALEKYTEPQNSVRIRREYIEEETKTSLPTIGSFTISPDSAVARNIENMIGCVQVPLGVAGPLLVNGAYATGDFWIPLATTEGALVASINRGCSVISKAGGAEVRIFQDAMTRAPVFAARSILHAAESVEWIEENFSLVKEAAEKTTTHGKLVHVKTYTVGTSVYVRLAYETGDAMGMNMATIASEAAAKVIEDGTGLRLIATSGNMCCDKKPAAINLIEGRGKTVSAGVYLSDELIRTVLKTTAENIIEVNTRKNLVGSARAGALGFNAHAANVIAAIFLATGQDIAHVVEGSNCITTAESSQNGVYVSVTLPSLQVGTVGGGTKLACQNECLTMLGCAGTGNAKKFAEIVAVAVLAGELSLLSALASGDLGKAHTELGRG